MLNVISTGDPSTDPFAVHDQLDSASRSHVTSVVSIVPARDPVSCSGCAVWPVSAPPEPVEVGRTVERNVGYATGWFCDDPALVEASLVTRDDDYNYWIVTGVKVGSTQCRVGTDPTRASTVFDVTVKRARSKRR